MMTRQEALIQFKLYAQEKLQNQRQAFWKHIENHQQELEAYLLESIKSLQEEITRGEKGDIAYFQFSLLRIDLLDKKYTLLLQAYDGMWYLDEAPIIITLNLDFIFEPLTLLGNQLLEESKKYVGKINRYDVNTIMAEEIFACNGLLAHQLRFLLKNIEEYPEFVAIPKATQWIIRWGEYKDESEIVLHRDRTSKNQNMWDEALEKSNEKEDHLVASYWYKASLEKSECGDKLLHFIGFEECKLNNIQFEKSGMLGAIFKNCLLKTCNFNGALLRQADFRGSQIEDVNFEEADLTGTIFSSEQIAYLHLSPEQLQNIFIERS